MLGGYRVHAPLVLRLRLACQPQTLGFNRQPVLLCLSGNWSLKQTKENCICYSREGQNYRCQYEYAPKALIASR